MPRWEQRVPVNVRAILAPAIEIVAHCTLHGETVPVLNGQERYDDAQILGTALLTLAPYSDRGFPVEQWTKERVEELRCPTKTTEVPTHPQEEPLEAASDVFALLVSTIARTVSGGEKPPRQMHLEEATSGYAPTQPFLDDIHDPEKIIADLFQYYNQKPRSRGGRMHRIIESDFRRQVATLMKFLYELWEVPTTQEKTAQMIGQAEEAIQYLQLVYVDDAYSTTAWDWIRQPENLTTRQIEVLRGILSRATYAQDPASSEGVTIYSSPAAMAKHQTRDAQTKKRRR